MMLVLTMLLLFLASVTLLLLHDVDSEAARAVLVLPTNEKRNATSSSLSVEEVEEKACVANIDSCQLSSNTGL